MAAWQWLEHRSVFLMTYGAQLQSRCAYVGIVEMNSKDDPAWRADPSFSSTSGLSLALAGSGSGRGSLGPNNLFDKNE